MTTDFYHIHDKQITENDCHVSFYLDPWHIIFKGHFPGKPVLPGVCMIQIIKEVFLNAKGLNAVLKTIQQVKFLEVIVPDDQTLLQLNMSWAMPGPNEWTVQADLKKAEKTFCKFKGIFLPVT